ncbi:MAG TPA: hypothetical protein ENN19_12690 [Chloroflexi bacterium]|nr:hypothetical protein [Chloroflexota bacterium]
MNLYIGKTLGRYQVVEQIGQGGMATVFKAYQPAMDRHVAVKILPSHLMQDATFMARFTQETRVLAQLEHPHILPVYDYGEQEGVAYLVMRYIEAGTLHDLIAQQGTLSLHEVVRIVSQVGSALGYAHDRGIIHRDIKPSNVLIDPLGNAFLTDFGIAKIVAGASNFTGTGNVIGTPDYMAPEQGLGKALDARCDLYSLGIMLYEMTTGRVPFHADTQLAVMMKHVHDPLPLPRSFCPDIPEMVERVILKSLAKSPDERFQTAPQMVQALECAVKGEDLPMDVDLPAAPAVTRKFETLESSDEQMGTELLSAQPEPVPHAPTESLPASPVAPQTAAGKRSLPWLYIAGGLLGLLGLVLVALLVRDTSPPDGDQGLAHDVTATPTSTPQPEATAIPAPFSAELVLDNQDPASRIEAGSWDACNAGDCGGIPYGDDFLYAEPGCVDCRASYNFRLATGGLYDVWAWWPRGEDRATDTPFTLVYGENETSIAVNQREYGNTWYPLATLSLTAGSEFNVIVGGSDTGYANFDALQLTPATGWRTYVNQNILHAVALQGDVVWVGGLSGVVRWASTRQTYEDFTVMEGLPDNRINALLVDDENRLWAATDLGIAIFDGKTWFALDEGAGLAAAQTNTLFKDANGGIWAGMSYVDPPLAYYDGSEWRAAPDAPLPVDFANPQILVYDEVAGLFVGLGHKGLAHFDGETWRLYTKENGLPDNVITGLQIADENVLYLTFSRGAAWMDVTRGAFTSLPELDGMILHAVYETQDGRLCFGGEGVYVYDPDDDDWTSFTAAEYPELDWPVRAIAEGDGVMWFATEGGGLLRYDGENFETWSIPGALRSNVVRAIRQDDAGVLWFAHRSVGLSRYIPDQGAWQLFDEADGAYNDPGIPGVDSAGQIWVGGYGQLRYYDGSGWRVLNPSALDGVSVYGVTFGPDDVMWVQGTYKTLFRYDPRDESWMTFTPDDHPSIDRIHAIYAAPDGTFWVAGESGLATYDGDRWQTETLDQADTLFKAVSGGSDGSIWAASANNLYHRTADGWKRYDWVASGIRGVQGAADGTVWVWSLGLGNFDPEDESWRIFTPEDGLAPGFISSVLITQDGVVWVGTDQGVSRYVP